MDSTDANPSNRPPVLYLADRLAYERLGPAIRYLLLGLIDEPFQPVLVGPQPRRRVLLEGALPVVPFEPPNALLRPWAIRAMIAQLREIIDRVHAEAPPIVHALTHTVGEVALRAAEALGADLVVSFGERVDLGARSIRALLGRAAVVIVPSDVLRDEVVRRDVAVASLELIRPGVPAETEAAAFRDPGRAPAIVYSGPVTVGSGVAELIHAFAKVKAHRPDAMLFLIGKGRAEGELRHVAERLDVVESVTFTGLIEPWTRAMGGADVYCLPRGEEAYSIVPIHAMSQGLTVIAGAGGVHDGLIDEQTAWTFPPGDVDALELRLRRALTQPDEARALAQRAIDYVRTRHSVAAMVEAHARVYRQLSLRSRSLPLGGR